MGQQWRYKYKFRGHYYFCDLRSYRMLLHPHKERIHPNTTRGSHSNKNCVICRENDYVRIIMTDVRTLTHVRTYVDLAQALYTYVRAYVFVSSPQ